MTDPISFLTHTDAYKLDHRRQYKAMGEVSYIYSNYTNRKSRLPGVDKVVHFGLQAYLWRLTTESSRFFAEQDTQYLCDRYGEILTRTFGQTVAKQIGTDHIADLHQLGYLPLEFRSLPEGTLVPIGVPPITVQNTHPDFSWLTNYVESDLSASYWSASTAATIAHEYRMLLEAAAIQSGADPTRVDTQAHDFSYRGMSSRESADMASVGHLLSFTGSDSVSAHDWIARHYGGRFESVSIPATEHSVMCLGTSMHGELEAYRRLLELYKDSPVAIVSDTYDLWRVLTEYLPALKREITSRRHPLVIRPDSGDPVKILLGDPQGGCRNERFGVLKLLANEFGWVTNDQGFRQLPPYIGVIYGDSITLDRAEQITSELVKRGWDSTSITLGVGSYSYQYVTRDTFGSAMKATWAASDGQGYELFKDPVTDDGTKRSARGLLSVERGQDGRLRLFDRQDEMSLGDSLLKPVWRNGEFYSGMRTFESVRRTLAGERRG